MRFAAMVFLVFVAASALSAPNPFRLPFLGGGTGNNHPGVPWQQRKKPDSSETGPKPWITLPFAPALNVPFYVPTIFNPRTASTSMSAGVGTSKNSSDPTIPPPIYSTIPTNSTTPKDIPTFLERRGASFALGNVPVVTPLPTVFTRGRSLEFDIEPAVTGTKGPTSVAKTT